MTDPSVPLNLPIADATVPDGWVSIAVGDRIRVADHYYSFFKTPPQWVIGTFFGSDGYLNPGRQSYARPSTLRAKLSVLLPVIRKVVRRWRS